MLRLLRPLWPLIAKPRNFQLDIKFAYPVGRENLYTFILLKCTNFLGPPGRSNRTYLTQTSVYTLIVISALKIVHILNSYKIAVRLTYHMSLWYSYNSK